jgi:anthraniloyl-CoA monooxygenase
MRVTVVGGGPAGLYLAALLKRSDRGHRVRVLERNAPAATFGWGVVFSEETLGALREADPVSHEAITASFARWGAIDVRYRDRTIRSRGHVFAGIARRRLLAILRGRCRALGVDLVFEHEVDEADLAGADLVVGADGIRSLVRSLAEDRFRPSVDVHPTRYIWLGTERVFDAFTFLFRETEFGLFQVHAYTFDARTSTFIVECPEDTWRAAGLDRMSEAEGIAFCEDLFAEDLAGRPLMSNRAQWINFITLRCESWHHDHVVLVGDAAHTAHFTIGSGTKLALEDSVALAAAIERNGADLERAFAEYELDRHPVVERFQEAARESASYFENVRRYSGFDPEQFTFNLLTRSGRITHLELERRDPAFLAAVDGWFADRAIAETGPSSGANGAAGGPEAGSEGAPPSPTSGGPLLYPQPLFAPLVLRGLRLTGRVVLAPPPEDDAREGMLGDAGLGVIVEAAAHRPALVLTDLVAVAPDGRVTPGSSGLYRDSHVDRWRAAVDAVHGAGPAIGLLLGHAGRRGATRRRGDGLDRPLPGGGWPLLAPSAIPYAPWASTPSAMDRAEMDRVGEEFVAAATAAATAGFDLLELDAAQGHLLASFLSPLANRRVDEFGGSADARLRYPLEVVEAVRRAWPAGRPLAVRLAVSDAHPRGLQPDEAVAAARRLAEAGADLFHVTAGHAIPEARPDYRRGFLTGLSDVLRNEAGVRTLVGGSLLTADDVNTVLAAGRGDLCVLDPRVYAAWHGGGRPGRG